jgi:anti-sigma factor RsiW
MTQLSDEILIAYADGELSREQAVLVEGAFVADPLCLERLKGVRETRKRLGEAFSSMLEAGMRQIALERLAASSGAGGETQQNAMENPGDKDAPESDGGARIDGRQGGRRGNVAVWAMVGGAALLCAGLGGGYWLASSSAGNETNPSPSFWSRKKLEEEKKITNAMLERFNAPDMTSSTGAKKRPASAAAPEAPEAPEKGGGESKGDVNGNKPWREKVAALHARDAVGLAKLMGRSGKANPELALFALPDKRSAPPVIPDLSSDGMIFAGAENIEIDGRKATRIVYRPASGDGEPVALYVTPAAKGSLALRRGYMGRFNHVRWVQGGLSYVLVGTFKHWRLIVLSVSIQRQLVG